MEGLGRGVGKIVMQVPDEMSNGIASIEAAEGVGGKDCGFARWDDV